MLVARGRVVTWDAHTQRVVVSYGTAETRTPAWWAAHGWLAFHTDGIEIVHPHAVQASMSADTFLSKLDAVWKLK